MHGLSRTPWHGRRSSGWDIGLPRFKTGEPGQVDVSTRKRRKFGARHLGGLRHGYIFSEIRNKYSINNWLSFNLNPKFSFTSIGNVNSISSSINWRLNPKFEIIPKANINLNNAENNFSLTGRTFLSKNMIIDTFVSNSFGVNDMANQFKNENTKYGVNLKIRL